MILPLDHIFGSLQTSKYKKPVIITLEIILVLNLVLVGKYILFNKSSNDKKTTTTQIADLVKPKSYKINGVAYTVPAKVLQIEPEILYRQISNNEPVQVIQISNAARWQQGHIAGSIFESKDYLSKSPNLSRDDSYVFVSENENDSIEIAGKLVDAGYLPMKVQSLKGGLSAWTAKGYKLEK